MTIDPVCGMEVDERSSKQKAIFQGQTYFFCSEDCKKEFDASPEDYIGEEEQPTGT